MKRIVIEHFPGKSVCNELDNIQKIFKQTVDGVNEYFISSEDTKYPYLAILVNGEYPIM